MTRHEGGTHPPLNPQHPSWVPGGGTSACGKPRALSLSLPPGALHRPETTALEARWDAPGEGPFGHYCTWGKPWPSLFPVGGAV